MYKEFCDICGQELSEEDKECYKVKREVRLWTESWWTRLSVHKMCWQMLCSEIMSMKKKEDKIEEEDT